MKTKTFEEKFVELEKFCEENNRMPNAEIKGRYENSLYVFYRKHKTEPEFVELKKKYGKAYTFDDLRKFCEENNRMPRSEIRGVEGSLYAFYLRHKEEPEFIELYEKYKYVRFHYVISDLRKFCEENNRMPHSQNEGESGLYNFYLKHKTEPEFVELKKKYSIKKPYSTLDELRKFCKENERMPSCSRKEEVNLYEFYLRHKNEPEFKELREKCGRRSHTLDELRKFCEENNRMPSYSKNSEGGLYQFFLKHKNEPEFIKLYDKYRYSTKFHTIEDLRKFCEENGRFPSGSKKEEGGLYQFFLKHKNEPEFKELREKYGRKSHTIYSLRKFCEDNGRLPSNYKKGEKGLFDFYRRHKNEPEFKELREKYSKKPFLNEKIQDFFNKYGRLPRESSLVEEERILGEELKKDPARALKGTKIVAPSLVMKDFEQFTVAQQYEVMAFFGIPMSFMDEACIGRKKKATTEAIEKVFKTHGAELEVKEDEGKISSRTQIGQIKRFSTFMSEYHADPNNPYLINESLNNLWDTIIKESKQGSTETYDELVSDQEITEFFNIVRTQLIREYEEVSKYKPGPEYSGKYEPDLMQKLCILRLREKKSYANWSKTGTGKTLQALLSSLDINSKITLYILPNSTIADKAGGGKKVGAIREFIPNSNVIIYKGGKSLMKELKEDKRNYILVNYDKLSKHRFLEGLEELAKTKKIDFICIDEIQMAKSRGDQTASLRNRALLSLRKLAEDYNKNLYVLGLTATPVINNLYEIKTLCEIITGKELGDDELFTGNSISFAAAQTAHKYLINYGFRYNHDYSDEITENEIVIPIQGGRDLYDRINEINDKFRDLGKSKRGMTGIKELEDSQIILKLEDCKRRGLIKSGVTIYTPYVGGVGEENTLAIINEWLRENSLESVLYTGQGRDLIEDKELGGRMKLRDAELQKFIGDPERGISGTHEYKILVASSVLKTGVDGLQEVSNTIIMLGLPWTYADYEQLKGRLVRKNSKFNEVNIYIPMISLMLTTGEWSWDRAKWEILQYKKDLSDLVIHGDYCNSNILRVAQNETESSLIEKVLSKIDAPLELCLEEKRPDINYREVKEELERRRQPRRKQKQSCITHIHNRYDKMTTQDIFEDMRLPERRGFMAGYNKDQLSRRKRKSGEFVDPNVETAKIINYTYGGPDKNVADLGCGNDPLRKLVTNCEEFFSCTFEPKEELKLPDYVVRCDSTRLTMIKDKYFDVVNHTNSHWGENLTDYVHEDYRILKDDGILIITSVCPLKNNKYYAIANAYLESGLWEYEQEPVKFGGHTAMTRGIFRKKRV